MTPEGRVKADIRAWLEAHGFWRAGTPRPKRDLRGWFFMPVNNGMGVGGIPDFMGSCIRAPGWVPAPFAIEAKAPGGKPTQKQLDRHAELRDTGWLVLVVDDVSQLAPLEVYLG